MKLCVRGREIGEGERGGWKGAGESGKNRTYLVLYLGFAADPAGWIFPKDKSLGRVKEI